MILVSYTVQKIDILLGKKGDEMQTTELRGAVGYDEIFGAANGLRIAFGLHVTNGVLMDESYGRFKVYTR